MRKALPMRTELREANNQGGFGDMPPQHMTYSKLSAICLDSHATITKHNRITIEFLAIEEHAPNPVQPHEIQRTRKKRNEGGTMGSTRVYGSRIQQFFWFC